jgi:hypothetical protein
MKRLRQLCAAIALTILLTNGVAAEGEGVMHPWYMPPPPPPATKTLSPDTVNGELNTMGEEPATDLAMEITVSLIQSMLALF